MLGFFLCFFMKHSLILFSFHFTSTALSSLKVWSNLWQAKWPGNLLLTLPHIRNLFCSPRPHLGIFLSAINCLLLMVIFVIFALLCTLFVILIFLWWFLDFWSVITFYDDVFMIFYDGYGMVSDYLALHSDHSLWFWFLWWFLVSDHPYDVLFMIFLWWISF